MTTTQFAYVYRSAAGKRVKGVIDAPTAASARARLRESGIPTAKVTPVATSWWQKDISFASLRSRRVKVRDVAVMARQLGHARSTGMGLLRALTIMADGTPQPALAAALRSVRSDHEGGDDLSVALAAHPKVFPNMLVQMVRAGETSGRLDAALAQYATGAEKDVRLRGEIRSAMASPLAILGMAALMLLGMVVYVVPTFTAIISQVGGTLPVATTVLVAVSDSARFWLPALIGGAVATGAFWRARKNDPRLRLPVDRLLLRIPIVGPLLQKVALARVARTLASLKRSGMLILEALDISADVAGNLVIGRALRAARLQVRDGVVLSKALASTGAFPPDMIQMIEFGEETNDTDTMLEKIAEFSEDEVERSTKALTSLIQPLLYPVLGLILGVMILGLYGPMFSIYNSIN